MTLLIIFLFEITVDRFFPSSKTCSVCGWINQDLDLLTREWTCENGHGLDRDLNAAMNILKEGLKTIGQGGSKTKVEDRSDYSGSMSYEALSPSHRLWRVWVRYNDLTARPYEL